MDDADRERINKKRRERYPYPWPVRQCRNPEPHERHEWKLQGATIVPSPAEEGRPRWTGQYLCRGIKD